MGYTHYFRQHRSMGGVEWENLTRSLFTVFQQECQHRNLLGDAWGEKPLQRPEDMIVSDGEGVAIEFNGIGFDACETFLLRQMLDVSDLDESGSNFSFCKTRQAPYDLMVMAALILAVEAAPDAWSVGSDGGAKEWQVAADFLARVFGRSFAIPQGVLGQGNG